MKRHRLSTTIAAGVLVAAAQCGLSASAIPWSELGARVAAQSKSGLAVAGTPTSTQVRCVYQRLEGTLTRAGLCLASTAEGELGQFCMKAVGVGRGDAAGALLAAHGQVESKPGRARWLRPGMLEEYSASLDGVRQEYLVTERPAGAQRLRLDLAVEGARAEQASEPVMRRVLQPAAGRGCARQATRRADARLRRFAAGDYS